MPCWQQPDHWRDRIVYVDIEELAACGAGLGKPFRMANLDVQALTAEHLVAMWTGHGKAAVDAYILPQPSGTHAAGVRYGDQGMDYLSVNCDAALLSELLERSLQQEPGPRNR